ncbi:MAG: 30S ribosome-binding factor RbfA [Planctomycetaceae bacterium]|jgi:ribosome-binding factor A|nr:30S ribosome-binding factor RbfA [Planctomycetaceae bacterium]
MTRRTLRAGETIRSAIGMAILTDIQDPRVSDVTITRVEVSEDLRIAKVFVSVMGDEAKQKLCLRGLQSAAGFLQAKLAERINTRYTPQLRFTLDQGVKHQLMISKMLDEVLPKDETETDEEPDEET